MSIFDRFKKKPAVDERLFGKWRLLQSEQAMQSAEQTIADFSPDGSLTYSVTNDGKTGIMKMTYRIEGRFIVSDQPSSPKEERTEYQVEPDGSLVLIYEGQKSRFQRA